MSDKDYSNFTIEDFHKELSDLEEQFVKAKLAAIKKFPTRFSHNSVVTQSYEDIERVQHLECDDSQCVREIIKDKREKYYEERNKRENKLADSLFEVFNSIDKE